MAQAVIGPVSRWHDSGIVGVGPGLWYGPTALDGAAGDWKRAPLGSIYVQVDASAGTAQTWQKVAKNGATADWKAIVDQLGVAGGQTIYGGNAANEDLTIEGTSHATKTTSYIILQPNGGNVGVGGVTIPLSSLHVAADSAIGRYTQIANSGTEEIRNNDNAISSCLTLSNSWAGANYGTAISFQHGYGGTTTVLGTSVASGKIISAAEQSWTATASTQDAYMAFQVALNGALVEGFRIASTGAITVTGGIRPAANGTTALALCNVDGTAIVTVDTTSNLAGINTTPATALHVAANEALAGNATDDYSAALTLDPAYTGDGIVTTVTLNAGGTGYTANDVITVVQTGGAGCTVTVNTVDGSGVITGITLLAGGTGYEVANALTTTGGTGSGGKINITVLTARTVTRHNYIDVNQLALAKGAAVTDAALLRFDAAVGTHKALLAGSTKTTPTGVDAWIPINANGTIMYIPVYASTTA